MLWMLLLVVGFSFLISRAYVREKKENGRLGNNIEALHRDATEYKVRDSLNASQKAALVLRVDEFEKMYHEQIRLAKDAKIKAKNIQSYVEIATSTEDTISTMVFDSVIVHDTIMFIDTVKCIDYATQWLLLKGCIKDNYFDGIITVKDNLYVITSVVYKKFLWWRCRWRGVDRINTDVINGNPHSKPTIITSIVVK